MKLMGSVMKAVQARVKGRFDGKTTAALVKDALS
ncbi:MAG: GatB/YqeY domain-containing protein [Propionibacterium sp.]|nr:GatB/YqeY domain-containing protein [Propionibacterium sp.]